MKTEFNFHELKAAERLPSPSGIALAIMKAIQRPDSNLEQIAQLVKSDPALSGRVLKFANSAAFGSPRSVVNVRDAVMMMGMQAVRNFALSLSLVASKDTKSHCSGFDYATYWSRSLAKGVSLARLSIKNRIISPEESFTLGLLADIGRLGLATAWPEKYGLFANLKGNQLIAAEQENFAIDSQQLTIMLLADWGISDIFIDSLRISFSIDSGGGKLRAETLSKQLAFAEQLAQYCLADDDYRKILYESLLLQIEPHQLVANDFKNFLEDVVKNWHEWGTLIDVNTDIRVSQIQEVANKQATLPPLDLLIVDDDPIMLTRLSKQLTEAGHRVSVCRDGEAALQHIVNHKPDVLLTDWKMTPVDGLSLCRTLRASSWGNSIYTIMITSTEDEDSLVEAFDAGVDDYVIKPINLRLLLARIRAGQRIVMLKQELEKENQDIQRYMAKLAVANRRLELMANTDALTGLANRRYAMQRLEQEWVAAQRFKRPLSVLMMDLDHFKSINDSLGHDAGDKVLINSANLIKESSRACDIACRLGGEEFLVIAPNTDGTTAMLLAERVRRTIEQNQPNLPLLKPVTVSIGVAGVSATGKTRWDDLIKLSDQALYQVKRAQRNSVKLATTS